MRRTTAGLGLVPGDMVRAAAVVSLAVGVGLIGGVAGALFLLVLGGVLVPRFLGLSATLDLGFSTSLLLAAWAAQLGWYEAVPWLDLLMHAVCTGLVAAVGVIALARWRMVNPSEDSVWAKAGFVLMTAGIGAVGAILWELGEWAGHTFLDESIVVGYQDTMTDLALGLCGATLAGVVLAVRGPSWRLGHGR